MSTHNPPRPAGSPIRSWSDAYAALRQRAGEARGWIELDTDAPDRRWPRTTGLDVILIAALIDAAFSSTDQTRFAGTALRWASCKGDLEHEAIHGLSETYSGNRDFWSCIAMMCAHLAFVGCPLPRQRAWNSLLAEIGVVLNAPLGADAPRNAHAAQDQPPVWFANAGSLDKLHLAQRSYVAKLHGSDMLAPEPGMAGGVMLIPRSTNAEVVQLSEFWTKALDSEKAKNADGYGIVSRRWTAALRDVDAHARGGDPNAVYPKNHPFWRAISSLAIHVAASNEHGMTDAEVWKASVGQTLQNVGNRAQEVAAAIATGVREAAAGAAHAAGRVVNEGARGLFGGLATPLLIGGGVITAYLLLRNRGEASREEQR